MTFTPFMQGTKAQGIIDSYLDGDYATTPNVNSAGRYRNPKFDLRTQQELAGELDPTALYPNPILDTSVDDEETIDPCQEGFMLVDGVCQPIETFGQSMYQENNDNKKDPDPREYYSIDEMKEMDDYEFLNYLTGAGAYMTGKDGQYTLNDPMNMGLFGAGLNILGLNSSAIRNEFMRKKLSELGYDFTNNKQGEPVYNLMQPMNIISNAEAANQGGNRLATNQLSIFTPEEINYQIDAKNQNQNLLNQGGNPYKKTMTRDEIIRDADLSGGTRNPFEMNNVNSSRNNSTVSSPPMNVSKPPFLR